MEEKIYIHYGHDHFDPNIMGVLKNSPEVRWSHWSKPEPCSGLWASPIDAEFGWKEWCEQEQFQLWGLDTSFKFKITKPESIYRVESKDDIMRMQDFVVPEQRDSYILTEQWDRKYAASSIPLDFEELQRKGYRGLEVNMTKCPFVYSFLYGWDCDSILIWDPSIIVEIK